MTGTLRDDAFDKEKTYNASRALAKFMINHGSLIHQVSSCFYSSARPLTVMLGGLGASTTVLQAFSRSACLSSPARPLTAMLGDLGASTMVPQAFSRSTCLSSPARPLAAMLGGMGASTMD